MWQVLGYQVAHGDQCKGEQSLNLCGNLDGDLKRGTATKCKFFFHMGNLLIEKNVSIKFCVF